MALPQPSLRFGGGLPWATKTGKLLAHHYDETKEIYKPIPLNVFRNSGGWRVNKQSLWEKQGENYPRIMFDENASGDLIQEPQRQNLWVSNLNNATFYGQVSRVDETEMVNPIFNTGIVGVSNYTRSGSQADIGDLQITGKTGENIVIWGYWKKGNDGQLNVVRYRLYSQGDIVNYDLNLGTVTISQNTNLVSTKIENMGNGIYYCEMVVTITTASQPLRINFLPTVSSNDNITVTNADFYCYGLQVEDDYKTTMIPDNSIRAADGMSITGLGEIINDSEGTLYMEGNTFGNNITSQIAVVQSTQTNNRNIFGFYDNRFGGQITRQSGGAVFLEYSPNTEMTNRNKFAFTWDNTSGQIALNGASETEVNLNLTQEGTRDSIYFNSGSGTNVFIGRLPALAYWDRKLTQSEIEDLTTNGLSNI